MVFEMKRKRFLEFVYIDCVSFTVLMVILSLLNMDVMVNCITVLQCFTCTTAVAALMYLTDKLPVESFLLNLLVSWADVAVVVFAFGWLFHWFTFRLKEILPVLGILTAVFVVTAVLSILHNIEYAKEINEKLKRRKTDDHRG